MDVGTVDGGPPLFDGEGFRGFGDVAGAVPINNLIQPQLLDPLALPERCIRACVAGYGGAAACAFVHVLGEFFG